MMSGLRITETTPRFSHMRSQIGYGGNNMNTEFEFPVNQLWLFMLFYRSDANMREIIVIYVLN